MTEGFFAPDAPKALEPMTGAKRSRRDGRPILRCRSDRAEEIFRSASGPRLLARLQEAAKPEEALLQFDGFLRGLPAGVQLFSLVRGQSAADPVDRGYRRHRARACRSTCRAMRRFWTPSLAGRSLSEWPGPEAPDIAELAKVLGRLCGLRGCSLLASSRLGQGVAFPHRRAPSARA